MTPLSLVTSTRGQLGRTGNCRLLQQHLESGQDLHRIPADRQALEVLVLRCPSEMATAIIPILNRALELVKYDPVCIQLVFASRS